MSDQEKRLTARMKYSTTDESTNITTIDADIIIRAQSPADASQQAVDFLKSVSKPAERQIALA